jgi:peptidoglycan hydrolase-like protein with peptidoglycan-binding domain
METLRIGDKGSNVKTLQLMLNQKGFNVITDGIFGQGTEDAVEEFQEKNHLIADGIVGKGTWSILLKTEKTVDRINDTEYVLSTAGYEPEPFAKKTIVLHHTNGWTVKRGKPSMNHFQWWKSYWGVDNGRAKVATAFSIDYDGNIYQHFDPVMWAYHLGLGGKKNFLDKQSIGIELCNEGQMTKEENGKFYWYSGKQAIEYNRPDDEPVFVKDGWRDYKWFAPYSNMQIEATEWLVKYLCDKYKIKMNMIADCDYHPEILDGKFEGIYNHANVRDYPSKTPKWDVSPAFPFREFNEKLGK